VQHDVAGVHAKEFLRVEGGGDAQDAEIDSHNVLRNIAAVTTAASAAAVTTVAPSTEIATVTHCSGTITIASSVPSTNTSSRENGSVLRRRYVG
tara:strand:+ start:306 stop:587 length:282 start_codon:yes stop_codon:yes gene_type:complete